MRTYDITFRVNLDKEDCVTVDTGEMELLDVLIDGVYYTIQGTDKPNSEVLSIKEVQ